MHGKICKNRGAASHRLPVLAKRGYGGQNDTPPVRGSFFHPSTDLPTDLGILYVKVKVNRHLIAILQNSIVRIEIVEFSLAFYAHNR